MANEIEAKIAITAEEQAGLEKKLKHPMLIEERNFIYAAPWMNVGEFVRLRLAKYGDSKSVFMTYKGLNQKNSELNVREEVNIEVKNYKIAEQFLLALGFKPHSSYAKKRLMYSFDKTFVNLDLVCSEEDSFANVSGYLYKINEDKAKRFLEIEGSEEHSVLDAMCQLGFFGKPIIRQSYADMFAGGKNERK